MGLIASPRKRRRIRRRFHKKSIRRLEQLINERSRDGYFDANIVIFGWNNYNLDFACRWLCRKDKRFNYVDKNWRIEWDK